MQNFSTTCYKIDIIKSQCLEEHRLTNFTCSGHIMLGSFLYYTEIKRGDKNCFMPPPSQHHPGDKNQRQPSAQSWRNCKAALTTDNWNKTLSTLCQPELGEHSTLLLSLILIASRHHKLSECM